SVACLPFLVLHFLNIGADQFSGGGSGSDILGALRHILHHGDAPSDFATTDMAYLQASHPETYQMVQDYLASLK
ncbi:MAG: hypothetical protein MK042_14960, partial [Cognatishimia sp.]|nr:hypothetical protein [Cognatishimia sp.]